MKKLLLCAIAVFAISMLNAQNEKGDMTLAPQIGVNLSTYASSANGISFDSRTSFAFGVIGEFYFNDRWSFRSGLLFDGMGANDALNITDKLSYITLPLNANWHFGKTRKWFLNFGPAISFLTKAESEFPDGDSSDIKDFVNGTSIGLALGIGYKFQISENLQLTIDYQGYGGFTDVAEDDVLPYSITNSRSSFNLGVIFKI
jgi:opacity protein-like surface antigen